jgi:hypothetical protein
MVEASAVKNLVSNRRTRPGGVIARAIKNSPDGSGNSPASAKGFHAPSSAGAARARARWRDLRTAFQKIGFELFRNRRGNRNAVVCLVDAPAGKDEFAGHEHHLVVAFADQNLWSGGGTVDQDQRGGVLGTEIRMMIGLFFFSLFFFGDLRDLSHFHLFDIFVS